MTEILKKATSLKALTKWIVIKFGMIKWDLPIKVKLSLTTKKSKSKLKLA